LPVMCRRPLVGYGPVALSTIATMLIGFGVWIHHMFATGIPALALSLFGAASMVIAVPSAIATFAWIATIWIGRPVFRVPMYYFAGFVLMFVIGGVSGVMTAAVPFDWQLTDTYFVVAHLHYVLLGINLFPVIGAIYFWFPKMTGRMMSERLGKLGFWVMFIGFNVAFFTMHLAGLLGMPRRIYTYGPEMGWSTVNLITSAGSFVLAFGILIFLCDLVYSLRHGAIAGDNPWDAPTLEWSVTSPPPPYNFAVVPTVASRHPLWEGRVEDEERSGARSEFDEGFVLDHGREALGTTVLEARPDVILKMPEDTSTPFWLGVCAALFFAGLALRAWGFAAAMLLGCAVSIAIWLWPERSLIQREPQRVHDAGG
jgi:cytochrome c oxidase subunit I+III